MRCSLALIVLAVLPACERTRSSSIEITRGQENAVPIAIVPFGWESTGAAPFDVAEVVAADLQRSGRFEPLDRKDMIDRPTHAASRSASRTGAISRPTSSPSAS